MKSLLRWQLISFVSRGLAMTVGIVQSIIIVRILSVGEYGLVTLATSIGSAFGIYQHLGLASGSTREISSAQDNKEVFKIFVTSLAIRYFITIPLAIILFFSSRYIAVNQYGNEALITPLKLFSAALLVQGVQSIFNSVISGTQRFKQLFTYQVFVAIAGLFIYIPLIYFYGVNGYFYSLILFTLLASVSLGTIALWPLRGSFAWPKKADFTRLLKDILSISLAIYVIKIIYTYWQKSGPLLLGVSYSPEAIGLFGFALLYATKLMAVSDSVTDINLPVLSKKFVENIEEFKSLFVANFDKVFAFIVFAAVAAVFWVRDIFHLLIGSEKYDGSFPFVLPLVFAFILYSVVNIVVSSILIPAKMVKEMITGFLFMLVSTVGFYFTFNNVWGGLASMSYAMTFGVLVGLVILAFLSRRKLGFSFMRLSHVLLMFTGLLISLQVYTTFTATKVLAFLLGSVVYIGLVFLLKVVTKGDIVTLLRLRK